MNAHLLASTTPSVELAGVTLAYAGGAPVLRGLDWQLLPGQVQHDGAAARPDARRATLGADRPSGADA